MSPLALPSVLLSDSCRNVLARHLTLETRDAALLWWVGGATVFFLLCRGSVEMFNQNVSKMQQRANNCDIVEVK